ncbi:hypothetical protein QBC43DRAFT_316805 [Cladorrhinum sp. PSN259]|nr:hypothetical protein QBC43DRAFT_316805 [Cladorrhinum sp. PSN259]
MSTLQTTYNKTPSSPSSSSARDYPGAVDVTGWDAKSILRKVKEWYGDRVTWIDSEPKAWAVLLDFTDRKGALQLGEGDNAWRDVSGQVWLFQDPKRRQIWGESKAHFIGPMPNQIL